MRTVSSLVTKFIEVLTKGRALVRASRIRRRVESTLCEGLESRVLLSALSARWSTTATNGSGLQQGDATTVTWSILPDGTQIYAMSGLSTEVTSPSELVSYLGRAYGTVTADTNYTDELWFQPFRSTFDRWGELSGVKFQYVAYDDMKPLATASGIVGVRADVRIGGHRIDGSGGTLAYAFSPNNADMVLDTTETLFSPTNNSISLRNVLAHESGHGLGLKHVRSSTSTILMKPTLNTSIDGPQYDDVIGLQRLYGDANEKSSGNIRVADSTPLGPLDPGETLSIGDDAQNMKLLPSQKSFVTIDDEQDLDFYSFTIASATTVTLQLTPVGPVYNVGSDGVPEATFDGRAQSNLTLQMLGPDGVTVMVTANNTSVGGSENISNYSLASPGKYFVRVSGSTLDKLQGYRLSVADLAPGTLSLALDKTSVLENGGSSAATATITRNSQDLTSPLVVTLVSNNVPRVTVPATVTIAAGQSSATFAVSAVNNLSVDGNQAVKLTASVLGFSSVSQTVTVVDDDARALTLTFNKTSFSEAAGTSAATGTVSRNTLDLSTSVVVMLSSNNTSKATVPSSVTIPAGQASATFSVSAIDNSIVDGTKTVTFTASSSGFLGGTRNVSVTDNELQFLQVSGTELSVNEGSGDTFTARLGLAPSTNVSVSVGWFDGDTDLSGGGTLTFTPANWNVPQNVIVTATEDADTTNGSARFLVSSTGLTKIYVTAAEVDNDAAVNSPPAITLTAEDQFRGVSGQHRKFTISASDSDADLAAGLTFQINWGDGTSETVKGSSETKISHIYQTPAQYTISVTASDSRGAKSGSISKAVSILSTEIQGTQVVVGGTSSNDSFTLKSLAAGQIGVLRNGSQVAAFLSASQTALICGGAGTDSIKALDQQNTWNLAGIVSGAINSTIKFEGIEALQGGIAGDRFSVSSTATGFLRINGNRGIDVLSYSDRTSAITLNLQNRSAPGMSDFTEFEYIEGTQAGTDILAGENLASTWYIQGVNTGRAGGIRFSSFESLRGGSGDDTFYVQAGGLISGDVSGGAGFNGLNYSFLFGSGALVNLSQNSATGASKITGISIVIGSSQSDSLTGDSAANILLGGAGNDQLFGGQGNDILIGGSGADVLSGGAGEDIVYGGQIAAHNESTTYLDASIVKSIFTKWTNGTSIASRVSNLSANEIQASKFADDAGVVDQLFGDADTDWYLVRLNDAVKDKASTDWLTKLT